MSAVESGRSSLPSLTLDAILRLDKRTPSSPPLPPPVRSPSNRTLLDIMREEHRQEHSRDKATRKTFMDKLRLKRAAAGLETSSSNPGISSEGTDISNHDGEGQRSNSLEVLLYNSAESRTQEATQTELNHHNNLAIPSDHPLVMSIGREEEEEPVAREGRMRLGAVLAEERTLSDREAESATHSTDEEGQTARISLMELLEDTDRQVRSAGAPRYALDELLRAATTVAGEDEADKHGVCSGKGGPIVAAEELNCCVCMVRNKGAAFIPCGHTFCRLCSRELWVQRGSCPLCNTFILEILDIF